MEFAYLSTDESAEWREWIGRNAEVRNGGLGLATEPTVQARHLGFNALDIAVDRDDTLFALRPSGAIDAYPHGAAATETLWTNEGEDAIEDPRAIAVVGEQVYVVDAASGDLVAISRRTRGIAGRFDARLHHPIDVVHGHQRIYALDGGEGAEGGRIVSLRRRGTVRTLIRGLESPVDISIDDSGNVYVLEVVEGGPVISIYDAGYVESPNAFPYHETITDFEVDETGRSIVPYRIESLSDGEMVVHGPLSETGEVATYRFTFGADGPATFERRYGFDRPCSKILAGPHHASSRYPTYYAIASEDDGVYAVTETKEYSRVPGETLYSARAYRRLDSGQRDTQWHRVSLGFDSLPSSSQVTVSYFASNDQAGIDGGLRAIENVTDKDASDLESAGILGVWDLLESDPESLSRAAEFASPSRAKGWIDEATELVDEELEDRWRTVRTPNPEDALLNDAEGRYLYVRLQLTGDVDTSPRVGSFRAYCPRQTYMRYLPEVFQEGPGRTEFMERFLSTFESAFVDVEEDVENVTRYFDPEGVSGEYLSWLASWLAIEYDAEWPEAAKREFLLRAPDLFEKRGTKEGMREILRLYLSHVSQPDTTWMLQWQRQRIRQRADDGRISEEEAEIRLEALDALDDDHPGGHLLFFVEHLDLDGIDDAAAKRPYTMHMRGTRSFLTYVGPFLQSDHREAVERIVADQKPAHADGNVVELRHQFKLESNTFLGINSSLTPREFVLGRATLGADTVLLGSEPFS